MSHLRKRFLAPGVSFLLLVVFLIVSAASKTAAAAPDEGNRVVVLLTLDPQTNKVTASPDPVALHYDKKDYADWQIAKESAAFEFTIGMEDQTDPKKRKPAKKLPDPTCSGTGSAKHCASIVPTSAHKGDHKYSVTVTTKNGSVVKTDPEVTIDP
jgi:hypothetical protein